MSSPRRLTVDVADLEVAARGKNNIARRPWGKPHAQDPPRSGRDRGPLRREAQLGGAAAANHASPAHANALGGRVQQPAASPPPTRGG